MTDRHSPPPPPPGEGGWGFPEHPGGDDAFRGAGAPPHVDDVLGSAAPPPPPGSRGFQFRLAAKLGRGDPSGPRLGRLDRAFPPHSTARLVLFVVAIPIIAAFVSLGRGGVGGVLTWAFVTISALTLTVAAWHQARTGAAPKAAPNTAPEPAPVVLADAGSRSTPGHVLTPFLVAFLLMAGFMLAIDTGDPVMSLLMSAVAGIYLGLLWHLRGTIPGLILASLGVGAVAAVGLGIIIFIGSLWGSDPGYNFWLYWLGSSVVAVPFIWPTWRRLRDFRFTRPMAIAFGVFAVATIAFAAISSRTDPPEATRSGFSSERPVGERGYAAGGFGAPTQKEAAQELYATWRFGNEAGAARVASPAAVDTLFDIAPTDRDRLLGCGDLEGQFSECRIESTSAGSITLGWGMGQDTYWIDYVVLPSP